MKKAIWITTEIIMAVLLVITIIWAIPVNAAQYGTNFKYKDIKEMQDDGWSISHHEGVTLRSDGIVLDGSKGVTTIAYAYNNRSGVKDWKVGATGAWLGGNGHSWLGFQVYTQSHTYMYTLEGGPAQYVLWRDGSRVIVVNGYQEAANSQVQIYLEKTGSSITLSYNSQVIKTYTENDSSPVTGVAITSPPSSAALYTWAGAFIPEPSAAGPTGDTPMEPTNPTTEPTVMNPTEPTTTAPNPTESNPNYNLSWANYNPGDQSFITEDSSTISGIQDNPGSSADYTTVNTNVPIPDPPLPPTNNEQTSGQETTPASITSTPVTQNANEHIWIVCLDGTFSMNTDKPVVDDVISLLAGNAAFKPGGVAQMQNVYIGAGSAEVIAACQHQQAMFEAGEIAPETHQADFNLYNGDTPSYYISGSTHISGDLFHPDTNQSAVAVFTYQVTDANGQVVYQNKITAVSSEGKTLAEYWYQAADDINAYLKSVINRPLRSSSGP